LMAHILVVDDDQQIRTLLGRYLKEQGYIVSLAANRSSHSRRLAANETIYPCSFR